MDSPDCKYVFGRDNYSCVFCHQALEDLKVIKLDDSLPWLNSNSVTTCGFCHETGLHTLRSKWDNLPATTIPGRLIVIGSCMFAGKTTYTKSLLDKYSRVLGKFIWVKPDIDTRGAGITTHNSEEFAATIISSARPDKSLEKLLEYNIVAIDEGQFFSERLLYVVHRLLKNGKLVIVNGLKLDFRRNIFGNMHYLLAEADEILSPKAICNVCNKIDVATRTKKKEDKGLSIEVGGADKYYVVCPDCDSPEV